MSTTCLLAVMQKNGERLKVDALSCVMSGRRAGSITSVHIGVVIK